MLLGRSRHWLLTINTRKPARILNWSYLKVSKGRCSTKQLTCSLFALYSWDSVGSASFCPCRSWEAAVMASMIGFLPPKWETWVEFLDPNFSPGHCKHLGSEPEDGRKRYLCFSNNTYKFKSNVSFHLTTMQIVITVKTLVWHWSLCVISFQFYPQ